MPFNLQKRQMMQLDNKHMIIIKYCFEFIISMASVPDHFFNIRKRDAGRVQGESPLGSFCYLERSAG